MIKHYVWENDGSGARVALVVDEDKVWFGAISGASPKLWVLGAVLADNEELVVAANAAAMQRHNDYSVKVRTGMSGARDYSLIERRDDATLNYPTVAFVHVSMYNKLNEGLRCSIGDLPPLLAAMMEKNSGAFAVPEGCAIREAPTRTGLQWSKPAEHLLAISDDGKIDYDRTLGAKTITAEMPLHLPCSAFRIETQWG